MDTSNGVVDLTCGSGASRTFKLAQKVPLKRAEGANLVPSVQLNKLNFNGA